MVIAMASMKEKFAAKFRSLGITGLRKVPRSKKFAEPVPVSASEIASFEELLGGKLPEDYRQFLLQIGGIFVDACVRPIEEDLYDDYFVPDVLYGGRDDVNNDLWSARTNYTDVIPDHLTPIGGDPGGDPFCIGIEGLDRGKVFFYDRGQGKFTLVANSFGEFLSRLEPEPDPDDSDDPDD
jgi:hypothetical protein